MLTSGNHINFSPSNAPARGTAEALVVKYVPLWVSKAPEAIDFLTQKMGFQVCGREIIKKNLQATFLSLPDKFPVFVLMENLGPQTETRLSKMVFNTTDCLKDFLAYKSKGVEFIGQPEYTLIGLSVEFTDGAGNVYTLLEERNYND